MQENREKHTERVLFVDGAKDFRTSKPFESFIDYFIEQLNRLPFAFPGEVNTIKAYL